MDIDSIYSFCNLFIELISKGELNWYNWNWNGNIPIKNVLCKIIS